MFDILPKWRQTREFAALWRSRRPSASLASVAASPRPSSLEDLPARKPFSFLSSVDGSRQDSARNSLSLESLPMTGVPASP